MSKNILKALVFFSIVSMVFVGGNTFATDCAYPLPVWGTWPYQSMNNVALFCGTSSDILKTRYNDAVSTLGRRIYATGSIPEGMTGTPTINSTVYSFTGYPISTHFLWQCLDSGGNSIICNATSVTSACDSSAGGSFNSAPTTNLCTYGTTASTVNYTVGMRIPKESGYGDYSYVYYWRCTNPGNTGDETYCFARANQSPTANAGTDKTVNEGQQVALSDATASDYHNDTLSYSWSCTGGSLSSSTILNPTFTAPAVSSNTNFTCTLTVNDGNGKTANDSLIITVTNIPVNGSCGTAQGHGYPSTSYIDTSAERCSAGTFTSFTDNGSSWSWSCNGINGGTNASCSANKVACGSYHTTIRRDQPSSNLCSYGNNTTLSLDSGIWYWMCTNNPGENVACYTYKTACGSANGGTYSSPPSTPAELCAYGSASSVTTGETTYTWTCTGNDSLAVSCSATRSGTVVNGSCGTAQGQLYSTPPSGDSNLCSAGSPSLVTSGSLAYTWTCAGSGGGSNANCSADRISFKNPSDLDTGNTDESCFYCDYYYDSNGYLQKGNLDTANKQAVPRLGFTVDNTKYSNYKIKIGNVEVASWIPISSSTVTYDGLRVKEGATSDSVSDSILTITYGNGTAAKTYGWYVKLQKTGGGETDWLSAGTFDTPKKPYPIVKIATASPTVYINSNVQYCTTTTTLNRATDTSNCFDICWKGTGDTADLSSSDWKCSVCFDSSANRTLCSISNSNQFSWNLPTAVGSYQNSTSSTSSNPVFKYTASIGSLKPGLAVAGSECAAEGETGTKTPLPIWRETAP